MFFQCMVEYRRENAKHLFVYLIGEMACQLDISDRPSWICELTSETIFISIGGPSPQLHSEVLNAFLMYGRV